MPIILDDLKNKNNKSSTTNLFTPKYFGSILTGTGGKVGIINEHENPEHMSKDDKNFRGTESDFDTKSSYKNGTTKVSSFPLHIISRNNSMFIKTKERPAIDHLYPLPFKQNMAITPSKDEVKDISINIEVSGLVLNEYGAELQGVKTEKELKTTYRINLYIETKNSKTNNYTIQYDSLKSTRLTTGGNEVIDVLTTNPKAQMVELQKHLDAIYHITIEEDIIEDFIKYIDLHQLIVNQSQLWQENAAECIEEYCKAVTKEINEIKKADPNTSVSSILTCVAKVLMHIETYSIPLNAYQDIYKILGQYFTLEEKVALCKHNLNLMLSDTLSNLDANRNKLPTIPANTKAVPKGHFSVEQKAAIMETNPLVLVQAGAGTGKSTVILGRIEHMIQSGIKPEDITVLSFTNAAADNITLKNPNVHSMTIAKMVHLIYSENFPEHDLSTIETIINALDIYYPAPSDFIREFKERLRLLIARNQQGAIVKVNNFIEKNYDEVIKTLNIIKQTSLELEILICYQNIGKFKEPAEVQSKYLIIDEVQDNSIFEFVYVLRYVEKHSESLFIVGDCAQTLYEFRASNPKALNILEKSQVFATHQLQINYRSNQEILDFANILLDSIDANQYAKIQLKANNLNPVTAKSFTDKVKLKYKQLNKQSDMAETIPQVVITQAYDYIKEKVENGEKVAILSYARSHIYKVEATLKTLFPNYSIGNLIPDRMMPTTYFSNFIKKYWDSIKFVPPQNIIYTIAHEMMTKLEYLVRDIDKQKPHLQSILTRWRDEQGTTIAQWEKAFISGVITETEFLDNVKDSMMKFEINNNSIRQALLSARNQENKKEASVENSNIILSTVHSAKGLEFDNTIIIYESRSDMGEEKKRMYYVALTRAMKSELILAFDVVPNPKIQNDYATVVKHLNDNTQQLQDKICGIHDADGRAVILDNRLDYDSFEDVPIDIDAISKNINTQITTNPKKEKVS